MPPAGSGRRVNSSRVSTTVKERTNGASDGRGRNDVILIVLLDAFTPLSVQGNEIVQVSMAGRDLRSDHAENNDWHDQRRCRDCRLRPTAQTQRGSSMIETAIDTKKQIIRTFYQDCLNRGQLNLLGDLVAPDFLNANGEKGASAFRRNIEELRSAFPDIQLFNSRSRT
jgi:hypothetical protein